MIDECRKLGLGTMLLHQKYKAVQKNYPQCEIVYLHVVDYNTSAIKFYTEKNYFIKSKTDHDYYEIFDKEYDAITLYIVLERPPSCEIYIRNQRL